MLNTKAFQQATVDVAIRIGLLFVLLIWCFEIIKPFVLPVIWAAILAVALHPVYLHLKKRIDSANISAALIVAACLALVLIPGWSLVSSSVDNAANITEHLEAGTLEIPAPQSSVKDWPLIGEKVHTQWSLAAADLDNYLGHYGKQLVAFGKTALDAAGSAIGNILMFCFSILISGVFLANDTACVDACKRFSRSCVGPQRGERITALAGHTIQSVAKGVLGVAVIQTVLVATGFFVAGIPAAPFLSIVVLVFAIAQLPPLLVAIPAIIYVFNTDSTTVAVIFTIWTLLASASDTVLKPLLLGRGVEVPMLVILLGALGGMLMSGIVGLFIGAVVLAVGYQLLMVWLDLHAQAPTSENSLNREENH